MVPTVWSIGTIILSNVHGLVQEGNKGVPFLPPMKTV